MNKHCYYKDLPDCCKGCIHQEFDSKDEYSPSYYFCVLNLILPTAKGTCKKREVYSQRTRS